MGQYLPDVSLDLSPNLYTRTNKGVAPVFSVKSAVVTGFSATFHVGSMSFENREGIFIALRTQRCEVFAERIVTYEGQSDANQFYKKLQIDHPISFIRRRDKWIASDTFQSPPVDYL